MVVKNGKTLTMVTATLVAQRNGNGNAGMDDLGPAFAAAIDRTMEVRRNGETTVQSNADLAEVKCQVEYGPVWVNEADARRHLERQVRVLAASVGAQDSGVFNVDARVLTTQEELDAVIREMTSRTEDLAVPLAMRKQIANAVTRLKQGKDGGRIRRTPYVA